MACRNRRCVTTRRSALIGPVPRDESSGHRRYDSRAVETIETLSCLRAAGMSVQDMRAYLRYLDGAEDNAAEMRDLFLFLRNAERVAQEIEQMQVRLRYLQLKADLWAARQDGDRASVERPCVLDYCHDVPLAPISVRRYRIRIRDAAQFNGRLNGTSNRRATIGRRGAHESARRLLGRPIRRRVCGVLARRLISVTNSVGHVLRSDPSSKPGYMYMWERLTSEARRPSECGRGPAAPRTSPGQGNGP
ncbi:MerR family transcriptional regulator [Nonomuraea candida]|uniref:MerR family transcriptional regulator n=1 Tax=Nonomuraea candida TaxID=359159 RepID=UPI0034E0C242